MSDTGLPPTVTPPPPDALKRKLGPIAPVRTRRPALALALVTSISFVWAAHPFLVHRVRPDLGWLPLWWLVVAGVAWLLAFGVALRTAILPPPGQVLPDGRRAERTAIAVALGLVALTLLLSRDAPGHSLEPAPGQFLLVAWRCVRFSLIIGAGVTVIALIALRRLLPYVSWRLGAAIGAAGGALAGFALHLLCGYASTAHVAIGHAGGMIGGALLGAALARALTGRSRETRPPAQA